MKPISKLCLARRAAGLKQKELGELVGVTVETISCYERGKHFPNFKTLKKLAQVLNCSYNDLFD